MKIARNFGMQAVSAIAIISMVIPAPAFAQAAPGMEDPTDAECAEIIGNMGLQQPSAEANATPGAGGAPGSANLPPIDRSNPGAGATPTPTPTPGATPTPTPRPTQGPAPTASPRPGGGGTQGGPGGATIAGGAIALPTGDAKKCQQGIKMAQSDRASVNRALANKAVLQEAARRHGIDWRLLAAIGVRETNFRNIDSTRKGDPGMGIFQLTNKPGVTREKAHDIRFAADYAAKLIAADKAYLKRKFPRLTEAQLLQATAAAYNFGVDDISGNPATIDKGTTRNNYGQNILLLMNCFS